MNQLTEFGYATPELFGALGVKLLRGRTLTAQDNQNTRLVAVINDEFVRRYLVRADPIGAKMQVEGRTWTIVGVVSSIQEKNGIGGGPPVGFFPEAYVPVAQYPADLFQIANRWFSPVWLIRTHRRHAALERQIQNALAAADPGVPFAEIKSLDLVRAETLSPAKYRAAVFAVVSGLALLLAGIGVYGLVSYLIAQRTREIGIRMAIGATTSDIIHLCITPTLLVCAAATICGLAGSVAAAKLLRNLIWNVQPTDTVTFVVAASVLVTLCAAAIIIPARSVMALDPVRILHEQ